MFRLFYGGYLKDKVYIFPMTSADKLKRKIIDNIRQRNLDTFTVVTENCCQIMHLVLARNYKHLRIFYQLWRYLTSFKNMSIPRKCCAIVEILNKYAPVSYQIKLQLLLITIISNFLLSIYALNCIRCQNCNRYYETPCICYLSPRKKTLRALTKSMYGNREKTIW